MTSTSDFSEAEPQPIHRKLESLTQFWPSGKLKLRIFQPDIASKDFALTLHPNGLIEYIGSITKKREMCDDHATVFSAQGKVTKKGPIYNNQLHGLGMKFVQEKNQVFSTGFQTFILGPSKWTIFQRVTKFNSSSPHVHAK